MSEPYEMQYLGCGWFAPSAMAISRFVRADWSQSRQYGHENQMQNRVCAHIQNEYEIIHGDSQHRHIAIRQHDIKLKTEKEKITLPKFSRFTVTSENGVDDHLPPAIWFWIFRCTSACATTTSSGISTDVLERNPKQKPSARHWMRLTFSYASIISYWTQVSIRFCAMLCPLASAHTHASHFWPAISDLFPTTPLPDWHDQIHLVFIGEIRAFKTM